MQLWNEIRKLALLGTERQTQSLTAPGALGKVLELIYAPENAASDREKPLLDALAVLTLYRRCGAIPTQNRAELTPCRENDPRPSISARAGRHLLTILSTPGYREVLPEWLASVLACNKKLLPELLPDLLDAGRNDRNLRPLLLDVIGDRGRWLAAQQPDWKYASGAWLPPEPASREDSSAEPEESQEWEEGTHSARVLYVERLRKLEPARARALVEAAFKTERARERAGLLETFVHELSLDDEPFLETCLDDKSKEVRWVAARLLASLSGSRLCQRMIARTEPLLSFRPESKTLVALLKVDFPSTLDEAMVRDGIVETPPRKKGKKSWWLEQMIASVPPSHWSSHWNVAPSILVELAQESDWAETLLPAWALATSRYKDSDWAEALLPARLEQEVSLWELLTTAQRETIFQRILREKTSPAEVEKILIHLPQLSGPWSNGFSRTVVSALGNVANSKRTYGLYYLYEVFRDCARKMSPEVAPEIARLLQADMADSNASKIVEEVLDILRFRQEMLREIASRKRPSWKSGFPKERPE